MLQTATDRASPTVVGDEGSRDRSHGGTGTVEGEGTDETDADGQKADDLIITKKGSEMYDIGEKPGKGKYCCTTSGCNWSVKLDDDSDKLPPCGNCPKGQTTKYKKC